MKVQIGPRQLLLVIKRGIENGKLRDVIDLIDEALEQIPEEAELTKPAPDASARTEG